MQHVEVAPRAAHQVFVDFFAVGPQSSTTMMNVKRAAGALLLAGLVLSWCGCAMCPPCSQATRKTSFEFALIGDVPYNDFAATNSYPNMIDEINRARLAFVVHNGDIKAGATPCTQEVFESCYRQFQTFQRPLIFLFGDNEWSDCSRTNGMNPENALAALREMFSQGDESLGQRRLKLARQSAQPEFSKFRENVRWVHGNVQFAGLNVPGNSNNYGQPEAPERNRANLAWLRESFALAASQNRDAMMLIIQANPHFEMASTNRLRLGFNELLSVLETETVAFRKPVVLVHGDSHYFRIDKPLISSRSKRRVENFTRVETFGHPDVHWIRARADWRDPEIFTFRQEIVQKNLIDHK
jgi:hypothetical protein